MKNKKKQSGMALILAVLAAFILMITGGALLAVGYQSRAYQIRTASEIAARCAADAGMVKALDEINTLYSADLLDKQLPSETSITIAGSDAKYSYSVVNNSGQYTVTSTGQSNGALHSVTATLAYSKPFDFGMFADGDIIMHNSAEIDWYNYSKSHSPLKIGTNSKNKAGVDLMNSIKVHGDIAVGAGSNPDYVIDEGSSIKILGDTYAQSAPTDLPSVTVPSYLENASSEGTIKKSGTISSSGKYDSINLNNSDEVVISGPVELYVTGDISLGNSVKFELDDSDPDSSLTIYLNGNVDCKYSSVINNNTTVPKNFKILGTDNCTSMNFYNSMNMHGMIYAPKADIIFHNSIEFYGSMVGKTLDLRNSAMLYYDATLREDSGTDLSSLRINRWTE